MSELPQLVPNVWITILESQDLKVKQIVSIARLDRKFVVYRDSTSYAHVFDRYSPQNGANLGVGLIINANDHIRCPFHRWTINSDILCRSMHEKQGEL